LKVSPCSTPCSKYRCTAARRCILVRSPYLASRLSQHCSRIAGWRVRMADVAVVTNSNCGLPRALVESLGITVVSLYYDLGAGSLRESEFDGDLGRFYTELAASNALGGGATTLPATVDDYIVVFERLLRTHSSVVAVLLTSAFSETCSNARQAAS